MLHLSAHKGLQFCRIVFNYKHFVKIKKKFSENNFLENITLSTQDLRGTGSGPAFKPTFKNAELQLISFFQI